MTVVFMHDLRAGLRRRKRSLELDANFHADQRFGNREIGLPLFLAAHDGGAPSSARTLTVCFSVVFLFGTCALMCGFATAKGLLQASPGPPKGSSLEPPWAALASWRQAFPSFANPSSSGEAWFTTPPATPDFPWNGVFVWLPRKSEPPSPPCHPLRCAGRAFPAFWERCHNDLSQ